jgi:hypothetical protein
MASAPFTPRCPHGPATTQEHCTARAMDAAESFSQLHQCIRRGGNDDASRPHAQPSGTTPPSALCDGTDRRCAYSPLTGPTRGHNPLPRHHRPVHSIGRGTLRDHGSSSILAPERQRHPRHDQRSQGTSAHVPAPTERRLGCSASRLLRPSPRAPGHPSRDRTAGTPGLSGPGTRGWTVSFQSPV